MTIIFENDGEVDLRAFSTFGCSVKTSKNPIGFFGTGGKYALAVLLRTGHQVIVQSGLLEQKASIKTDAMRGKDFDFVFLGDTPLGFTTELGKNWEVWMAYRELHCNAVDESGSKIYSGDAPMPTVGKTRIIVTGEAFFKAHDTRHEFILEGEPAFKVGTIEVHTRPSQSFFYRGIKVMELQKPALYTYNQTAKLELTEDRTAKDPYQVLYAIAREILAHGEKPMLEKVLIADDKCIEHHFDFHGWTSVEPSRDFFATVNTIQRHSVTKINHTALRLWREKGGGFVEPRRINPTNIQFETLQKAIGFCEKSGFMLRDEYPIFIVETLGEGSVLALADRGSKQIFLTETLFNQDGTKGVARALIEEYLHLKFGFTDCSREMQNYLFAKMVSLAEELTGEPL